MTEALATGSELLYREARCLDERRWAEWLELFTVDCTYWAPASLSPSSVEFTTDPRREVSLIYYDSRQGLADRVSRLNSGEAFAIEPLPRTCHAVFNIMLDHADAHTMRLAASWRVDYYRQRQSGAYFGHYRYDLVRAGDDWKIANKTIYVLNDYIPTVLDFFQI